MTLKEYLLGKVKSNEYVIIMDGGVRSSIVWVDEDRRFIDYIDKKVSERNIQNIESNLTNKDFTKPITIVYI